MIVAIDGPAGSGKSTVARGVARRLGFTYLDSGALYRAVTLVALEARRRSRRRRRARARWPAASDRAARREDEKRGARRRARRQPEIRSPEVTGASSTVAAHPGVRAALLEKQRALIAAGNYVVEGRDIGTVVAPDAALKVFLTADADERARRRAAELERRGLQAAARGRQGCDREARPLDSTRSAAPLRAAEDAVS